MQHTLQSGHYLSYQPVRNARASVLHFLCAGAIGLAALWISATTVGSKPLIHGPYWSLLLGEWVATWAFGFSWFAKGAEIRYLFGFDEPAHPVVTPALTDD